MDSLIRSNISARPIRTLVSVAGVALGVTLVILFTGLTRGMSNDMQRRASNLRAEIVFTRPGSMQLTSSTSNLSTKYVDLLKKIYGVGDALPVMVQVLQGNRGFGLERIQGVDWDPYAAMNDIRLIAGGAPKANNEVVIDETKARNNKSTVGSTLNLIGDQPYRVVGIYSPESGARVKMSLRAMQEAFEAIDKCTYIMVKVRDGSDKGAVAKRIADQLPGNKVQ